MVHYVDIPVPEALEDAVVRFSHQIAFRGAVPSWDATTIDAHLRSLPPEVRYAACRMAELLVQGRRIDDEQLARELGVSPREAHGVVQEINDPTIDPFPGVLAWVQTFPTDPPGGVRRQFMMLVVFADLICEWIDRHGRDAILAPATA